MQKSCPNCHTSNPNENRFCSSCGQKLNLSDLSFKELVGEFFRNFFSWDNGFWYTLRNLWIPGKLTREFVDGKRKRQFHPIRFFMLGLLLYFAILSQFEPKELRQIRDQDLKKIHLSESKAQYYEVIDSLGLTQNPVIKDTIPKYTYGEKTVLPHQDTTSITFNLSDSLKSYSLQPLTTTEVYNLEMDSVHQVFKDDHFFVRILKVQFIRMLRNMDEVVNFIIGNLIYAILVNLILISLLMKLLYIRRQHRIAEHFLGLIHIHNVFLVLTILLYLLNLAFAKSGDEFENAHISIIVFYLYMFLHIKFYYHQGWLKSLVKFFIASFIYFVCFLASIFFVSFISFLIYA